MPRFDGDFLFCWTAMMLSPFDRSRSATLPLRWMMRDVVAPVRSGAACRRRALAFRMARRERQRQQQLVLDQRQRIERCRGKQDFGIALRIEAHRLGVASGEQ